LRSQYALVRALSEACVHRGFVLRTIFSNEAHALKRE
jgi:hypothetical protein